METISSGETTDEGLVAEAQSRGEVRVSQLGACPCNWRHIDRVCLRIGLANNPTVYQNSEAFSGCGSRI